MNWRNSNSVGLVCGLLGVLFLAPVVRGQDWMINEDYVQSFVNPKSNFEKVLGNTPPQNVIAGGMSSVTNPFNNPQCGLSYDGTDTTVSWFGDDSLPQDLKKQRHFGIFGMGPKPKVKAAYWTPTNNNLHARVPAASFDWFSDGRVLVVAVANY